MEESRLYLIFEFLSMDLKKYMDTLPAEKMMDTDLVRSYLYQISAAMLFCHQRRILHRDLKPQNLLINKNGVIKVSKQMFDIWYWHLNQTLLYVCNRLLILDWGELSVFPCVYTLMKLSHCGIVRRRYCWALHVIHAMWTFGPLDAFLLRWLRASHCFKAIPKLISCSVCSGKLQNSLFSPSLLKMAFWGQLIVTKIILCSILKTPTEDIWPGVTCLPDYKETFPCWTSHQLKEQVPIMHFIYMQLSYLMQLLFHSPFRLRI